MGRKAPPPMGWEKTITDFAVVSVSGRMRMHSTNTRPSSPP